MSASRPFVRRETDSVPPFAEICGDIRGLMDAKDNVGAEIYYINVRNADPHFHKKTEEFYYVLDGHGTMQLDGEIKELHKGVLVYIPCGIVHRAEPTAGACLTVLVVAVPKGLADDIYDPAGKRLTM
jgi:mannose-6-phosphate isomerase-like protein (cupin superfamily)